MMMKIMCGRFLLLSITSMLFLAISSCSTGGSAQGTLLKDGKWDLQIREARTAPVLKNNSPMLNLYADCVSVPEQETAPTDKANSPKASLECLGNVQPKRRDQSREKQVDVDLNNAPKN